MIECPNCGKLNFEGKFCGGCGKELPEPANYCPNCDSDEKDFNQFCTNCGERLITKSQHLENIKFKLQKELERTDLHERLSLTIDDAMLEIFKKEESLLHLSKDEVINHIICEYPGNISSLIQRLEIKANEEKSNQIEEDLKFDKFDYLDSIVDDNLLNKLKDYFPFNMSRENIINYLVDNYSKGEIKMLIKILS